MPGRCRAPRHQGGGTHRSPEILGGRVKTLHPRIHGGILGRPSEPADQADMETQNIPAIELVVVNLYPFEATIAKAGVSWDEAIEKIDIGGPAMVRAAAKNHAHVSVLTSPNQYERILSALMPGRSLPSCGASSRSKPSSTPPPTTAPSAPGWAPSWKPMPQAPKPWR